MKRTTRFFILSMVLFFLQFPPGYGQSRDVTSSEPAAKNAQPLDIVLVLDNSGSMKKNDPQFLTKEVVTEFMTRFGENCRLAMVIFDREPELAESLMDITDSEGRTKFLKSLDKVTYNGQFSNIPAAIERAIYELKTRGRKDAKKIIIFLTDGIVDTGEKENDLERERWLKQDLAEESSKQEIRIFSIAFTASADFSLIQTLAIKTGGEYFRAYTPDDIKKTFEMIRESISRLPKKKHPAPQKTAQQTTTVAPAEKGLKQESPQDQTPRQSSVTIEVEETLPVKAAPAQEDNIFLHLILAGILVVLGVTVMIMVLVLKSKTPAKPEIVNDLSAESSKEDRPIPSADLVDVEDVTGKKTFVLDKKITKIGRNPDNDISIPKKTVSSLHAMIEYKDGFFYLEDQRSMNKTYLGGEEIVPHTPKRLKSGDEIILDVYKFIFILPDQIPSGETVIHFEETPPTVVYGDMDDETSGAPSLEAFSTQAMVVDVKSVTGEKDISLKKRVTKIGRGMRNEIIIPEERVSGLHATIEYKNGFFLLEDQRSRNKTFLNGKEISPNSPVKLKSGDEIMFDGCEFVFLLEGQVPSGETGEGE